MRRFLILLVFLTLVFGFIMPGTLNCQTIANPEEEYNRIRTEAFQGNYAVAETDARRLVNQYPSYGDARILLGRIHAWQGEYDVAAAVIDTLLMTDPDNEDALAARSDIKRWARYPADTVLSPPTDVRLSYSFDTYSEPDLRFWQMIKADAGNRFSWGTAMAGINIGNVHLGDPLTVKATEWQAEAEAWPQITQEVYAYLSYAYSPGIYFPKHRAAVEVWQTLPAGFAVSAGLNYYHFDRDIFIAGFSGEKYLGDYWLSAKAYFYFKNVGVTTSFYLNARRYFNKTDYLQVTLGTGTAPDEPFDIIADLERLSSHSVRLAYVDRITTNWSVRLGAGYSYEEYAEGSYRNRFEGLVGLIYAFRLKQ